jgi:hypothetical protein
MQEWTVTYLDMDGRRVSVVVDAKDLDDAIKKIRYSLSTQASQFTGAAYNPQKDVNVPRYIEPEVEVDPFVDPADPGLEMESARAAFQQFLGTQAGGGFQPTGPRGRARTLAESQFNPLLNAAFVQQELGGGEPGVAEGREFESFLSGLGSTDPRAALRSALGTARTSTRANIANPFGSLDPALEIIRPQDEMQALGLANLAQSAQTRGIAPIFRNRFRRSDPRALFGRFAAGREAGSSTSFVDFLTNIMGLERLGFGSGT